MFARTGPGAKIKNLGIDNVNVTGYRYVGGLVGWNEGKITASYATGNVYGYYVDIGGFVGKNEGTIEDAYARGDVTALNEAGGLVGDNAQPGEINRTYATGSIQATSATPNEGGLIGLNGWSGQTAYIRNSYWDIETSGHSGVDGWIGKQEGVFENIVGLTTSEMQGTNASTNMDAFDFDSVWKTVDGDYPVLQWQ